MFKIISTCKGGGYLYARTEPKHPKANKMGLYPLHRVLMENKLGRVLEKSEVIHHKDGNKFNNLIENLEVLSNSEHTKLHKPAIELILINCAYCKVFIRLRPNIYRLRLKRTRQGICCSRQCATRLQFNL